MHVYDVDKRRFPPALNGGVPESVRSLSDPVLGLAADASGQGNVLMWGGSWVVKVRLGGGLGSNGGPNGSGLSKRAKRKLAGAGGGGGAGAEGGGSPANPTTNVSTSTSSTGSQEERFTVLKDYRSLLGVEFVGERELVLVERPWLDLVASLPPSYFKGGRYGT